MAGSPQDAQQKYMETEMCIIVDLDDKPKGFDTKKNVHLWSTIEKGVVHRAFSVFLFNSDRKLLLQQRAASKITFPSLYTNTCCSHPLYIPDELVEENHLGVKRAAQRKLEHELGIPVGQVPIDDIQFITRIFYTAKSDDVWGESEIDHILIAKGHVTLAPSPDEVSETRWVSRDELFEIIKNQTLPLTPWFKLIANRFLFEWWDQLDNLSSFVDKQIHHLS
eukprot:TRINITY_DN3071_c0_g1_i1.p1 TRINITY_DN3071_c0_g1~~TRINITY_DN3071_c0_g1_i1.p1  ORF type:complete len:222 (+),score=30.49 TRINITY_DN3071_c0_g1_i1:80-745(+)